MRPATLAIHAGQRPDPSTGAIMPPVYQTSTYVQSAPGEHLGYEYARTQNPTREALERCVAALEGARHGIALASGCAATSTLLHLFKAGDHIVCADDVYGGTYRLFTQVFTQMGIRTDFVDLTEASALAAAIRPETVAIWLETPSNPLLKVLDLAALAAAAHARGLLVICDNTFATPILQQPLALGCDVVVHSTTKYINGHSDVIGGMICVQRDDLGQRLRGLQNAMGAICGPWDAWLVLRGVKTLPLRMRAHCANGQRVATTLQSHPRVVQVRYPGLTDHPQHALAARQMRDFGGMIAFEVAGGEAAARRLLARLQLFALAESLGGVESLVEHPASMTHAAIPEPVRTKLGITPGLLRLSVGIEDGQDLVDDLEQALRPD